MTSMTAPAIWLAPPRAKTAQGRTRRVGVELEFGGLTVADAAAVVRARFGGDVEAEGAHRATIRGGRLGDFACKLDVRFAHKAVESEALRALQGAAAALSAQVLPVEIVCPPIPWTKGGEIDGLVEALTAAGALGTRESVFYAFGMQLNPELPALDMRTILPTFRAFLALRGHLRRAMDVDPSRRLWSFETPFSDAYAARVLDPLYWPTLADFIADYLDANATRNRELDLLPLLAHLDEARVRAALPDETISARPTWHYRLPNSDFGAPGWSVGREWARWLLVERLAARPVLLEEAARRARADGDAAVDDIIAAL